jgi:hypothetical protein
LKICFEKLEKEKERKFIFIRILVQLSRSPPPRPAQHAARLFFRGLLLLLGRARAAASRPNSRARSRSAAAASFRLESLTCGSRLSVSLLTFPFFFLRCFPKTDAVAFLFLRSEAAANLRAFLVSSRLRTIKTEPRMIPPSSRLIGSRFGARELGHREHEIHRPPLQAARAHCFIPGHDSALGEFALKLSTCRYLCFVISCTTERVRLHPAMAPPREARRRLIPTGAPPVTSLIRSGPSDLNPTDVNRSYRFGCTNC